MLLTAEIPFIIILFRHTKHTPRVGLLYYFLEIRNGLGTEQNTLGQMQAIIFEYHFCLKIADLIGKVMMRVFLQRAEKVFFVFLFFTVNL